MPAVCPNLCCPECFVTNIAVDQWFRSWPNPLSPTLSIWRRCHARYGTKKPQDPEEISRLSDVLRARRNSQVVCSYIQPLRCSWDSEPKRRHLFIFHIVHTDGVPTPLELAREVPVTPMNGEVGVIVPQEHRTVFRDPNLTASRNDVPIPPPTSVAIGTDQSIQQLLRAVIVCFINHRISFHKDRTHCSRTQYAFARGRVRTRSKLRIPTKLHSCSDVVEHWS